jgi:hypothetical protein
MDILTFASEIIKSLAWPATLVFLALFLKKPVTQLIPFLRKLKYKELEMEFAEGIAELKAVATLPISYTGELESTQISAPNPLIQMATFSTLAAVISAWAGLEAAATEAAGSLWNGASNDVFSDYRKLGEYLLHCKIINTKQLETFNKLRQLRNKVVHAEQLHISEEDARSYVELAYSLTSHMSSKSRAVAS